MTARRVLTYPHSLLKQRTLPIRIVDTIIESCLADLADTLDSAPGVGIAAPQIGESLRAVLIDMRRSSKPVDGTNHGRLFLLNPEVITRSGVRRGREGCLSLPEIVADVVRSWHVRVRYMNESGDEQATDFTGFEATAVQHELDHLDGVLFVDRVSSLSRSLLRRGALPKERSNAKGAVLELLAGHLMAGRELVGLALRLAAQVYEGQTDDQDAPGIEHPIRVARTLVWDVGVSDPEVIAAALLHEVLVPELVGGRMLTASELAAATSARIAALTQSVCLGRLEDGPREAQLIMLAARLDEVRSILVSSSVEKKRLCAHETFQQFVPVARALGVLETQLGVALASLVESGCLPFAEFTGLPGPAEPST